MKSRNLHSEIVFCLGTNNNIATTLNTFGISATTSELIVVKVVCPSLGLNAGLAKEDVEAGMKERIEGEMVQWGQAGLQNVSNVKKIEKLYKLGKNEDKGSKGRRRKDGSFEGPGTGVEQNEQTERKELEVQILGLMALRGAG